MLPWSERERGDEIRLSEVVGALSYALDLVEGQPQGHASRSCLIGMRLAREIGLMPEDRSALFYALLLKDLGCSSNSSKVCYIFGADDRSAKCDLKTVDWRNTGKALGYIARNAVPGGPLLHRAGRMLRAVAGGKGEARELVKLRCDRGATIAAEIGLPPLAADAIRSLDEHWDGGGYPRGLAGDAIPMLGRILGLAQTAEVFWNKGGPAAACEVAAERGGRWFDPELVRALVDGVGPDADFWATLAAGDVKAQVSAIEPLGFVLNADAGTLDRLAGGFGQVIDAKSPWTFAHSTGVAEVALGIGRILGLPHTDLRDLRRAALLHDVGKLGVSNTILDKPGKLTPEEFAEIRKHPTYTYQILSRVAGISPIAEMAASHHERLDGKGYHRGVEGSALPRGAKILAVADMYEALAARRPYRSDLSAEEVMTIIDRQTGAGLCPEVVAALKTFVAEGTFVPVSLAAA